MRNNGQRYGVSDDTCFAIGEPAYDLRDVWIPKDGELFIVSIWTQYTNPDGFAAFQAGADLLLNSLRIK